MLIAKLSENAELRLLELHHAPEYHRLVNDNFARLYWLPGRPEPADAEKRLRAGLQRLADGSGIEAGIFLEDRLVGTAGLFRIEPEFQAGEIGYWIDKAAQGRGLVTHACRALLRYAFEDRKLHRIELRCAASNTRSMAVATRLGFRQEGRLRLADRVGEAWEDFLIYGLLEEEWAGGQDGSQPGGKA